MASSLEVGRNPGRLVVQRFEQDGLIENLPRKGAFYRIPTATEVLKIYQIQEALEGLAARLAVERSPAEDWSDSGNRISSSNGRKRVRRWRPWMKQADPPWIFRYSAIQGIECQIGGR
jgi:hypothetical protein